MAATIKIRFGNDARRFTADASKASLADMRERLAKLFGSPDLLLFAPDGDQIESDAGLTAALKVQNKNGVSVLTAAAPSADGSNSGGSVASLAADELEEMRAAFKEVLEARRSECTALKKTTQLLARAAKATSVSGDSGAAICKEELQAQAAQARERLQAARGWMDGVRAMVQEKRAAQKALRLAEKRKKRVKEAADGDGSSSSSRIDRAATVTTVNVAALAAAAGKLSVDDQARAQAAHKVAAAAGADGADAEDSDAEDAEGVAALFLNDSTVVLRAAVTATLATGAAKATEATKATKAKSVRVTKDGIEARGGQGKLAQFKVVRRGRLVQLHSVASPGKVLRITRDGSVDANGHGGPFCWFRVRRCPAGGQAAVTLQSKRLPTPTFLAATADGAVTSVSDPNAPGACFAVVPIVAEPATSEPAANVAPVTTEPALQPVSNLRGRLSPEARAARLAVRQAERRQAKQQQQQQQQQQQHQQQQVWPIATPAVPAPVALASWSQPAAEEVEVELLAAAAATDNSGRDVEAQQQSQQQPQTESAAEAAADAAVALGLEQPRHVRQGNFFSNNSVDTARHLRLRLRNAGGAVRFSAASAAAATETADATAAHGQTVKLVLPGGALLAAATDGSLTTHLSAEEPCTRFVSHSRGGRTLFESSLYPGRFLRIGRRGNLDTNGRGGPWCQLETVPAGSSSEAQAYLLKTTALEQARFLAVNSEGSRIVSATVQGAASAVRIVAV